MVTKSLAVDTLSPVQLSGGLPRGQKEGSWLFFPRYPGHHSHCSGDPRMASQGAASNGIRRFE